MNISKCKKSSSKQTDRMFKFICQDYGVIDESIFGICFSDDTQFSSNLFSSTKLLLYSGCKHLKI